MEVWYGKVTDPFNPSWHEFNKNVISEGSLLNIPFKNVMHEIYIDLLSLDSKWKMTVYNLYNNNYIIIYTEIYIYI